MTVTESFIAWRRRVHERVCAPARSCTCTAEIGREVIQEARDRARRLHAKYEHPGRPETCGSSHDVICKAVWP